MYVYVLTFHGCIRCRFLVQVTGSSLHLFAANLPLSSHILICCWWHHIWTCVNIQIHIWLGELKGGCQTDVQFAAYFAYSLFSTSRSSLLTFIVKMFTSCILNKTFPKHISKAVSYPGKLQGQICSISAAGSHHKPGPHSGPHVRYWLVWSWRWICRLSKYWGLTYRKLPCHLYGLVSP